MKTLFMHLIIAIILSNNAFAYHEFVNPNPSSNDQFGVYTVVLTNGNVAIAAPQADINAITDCGAVYLYNGATGELISTLIGSSTYDNVGSRGITGLPNGNFVVNSPDWKNGTASQAGAVTFCNGSTGLSGAVSSSNSLVGSNIGDQIGYSDQDGDTRALNITVLPNGNYLVRSKYWMNGSSANAGAVTWCSGSTGLSGAVSASNSLVGSSPDDEVGSDITVLTNGNYVVRSYRWTNGLVAFAGAVTWCSGSTGLSGAVSTANSLYGTQEYDEIGGTGITALNNGNYVVNSETWSNGLVSEAGAVTWCNGTTGRTGAVSTANSLYGGQQYDNVGNNGVFALTNGNYVVDSDGWSDGVTYSVGAVTWCNGATGRTGAVSTANSLCGTQDGDQVGIDFTVLPNGNYVVRSMRWANGGILEAGAVTWCNGATGRTGAVSTSNSLYGTQSEDNVGSEPIIVLSNGNYLVRSSYWDNALVWNAGAVTWCNGASGLVGAVSTANSLVGTGSSEHVGYYYVVALTNGNYVVASPFFTNGGFWACGAVTWCNGATGGTGAVSTSNSLVGTTLNDRIGYYGVTALSNGNYLVLSVLWDNGTTVDVGAITWCNGTTGTVATVSAANSLVGTTAQDNIGSNSVDELLNGNYVVRSPYWDNASIVNAGAVTWCNGATGRVGAITSANSLIGSTLNDNIGNFGITILSNSNYIVKSYSWNSGPLAFAGAYTWCNGSNGSVVGEISTSNSIIGPVATSGLSTNVINTTTEEFYSIFVPFSAQGRVYRDGTYDGFTFTPSVTTSACTSINTTSSTGNGNITATNGENATVRGAIIYPYTNTDLEIGGLNVTDVAESGDFGTGAFTASLTSLSVNTQYNVRAYAISPIGTGYGSRVSFWTLANIPGTPTVDNPTLTTLDVSLDVNSNPAGTEFAIQETGGSGRYVQTDGTLGGNGGDAVWQTATLWDSPITITGLIAGTTYTFKVKAKNALGTETNFSSTAQATTLSPEINIQGNNTSISDGDVTPSALDDTQFGNCLITGATVVKTYTIENLGNGSLVLSGNPIVAISGLNAADFTVSQQPNTPIAATGTTTFEITFDPTTIGAKDATVSIANSDADENPYTFAIQGNAINAPTTQASNIFFSNISRTGMTVGWTRGNGEGSLLLGKESAKISATPLLDGQVYNGANSIYTSAPTVGGAKLLYNGTAANPSVSVTGLTKYKLLYFKVCEYNNVLAPIYLQTENASNPRSRWTLRRDALIEEDLSIDMEYAYPNPVSNSITTTLDLFEAGTVTAKLYDINGKLAADLYNQALPFGTHEFKFDVSAVPSGVYQLIISKGSDAIVYPVSVVR